MEKIARFEKVSKPQFEQDFVASFPSLTENTDSLLDCVKLPIRATAGSAGYDFFAPTDITLAPKQSLIVPTGIRAKIADGWVLCVFPRSGLGFKYRLQLDNTVGVIDSDYYGAKNEGHIKIKLTNDTLEEKTLTIAAGTAFAQGIFLPYGVTEDDEVGEARRVGGFGSTD